MRKITYIYCFIFMLLYFSNIYSQYNARTSSGYAPFIPVNGSFNSNSVFSNPNSIGYSYYPAGPSSSRLFRYNVGTPGNTTPIGNVQPYLLGSGDFANPTGTWKFYVQDQNYPFTIYQVDTVTGNLTSVGIPLDLKDGHKPVDFEWDQVSGSFYMISTDTAFTETQFYKVSWPSLNLSWVGNSSPSPSSIVAGGFNSAGTYFGIDLNSDALWKANRNTGVWTYIGPLGYPVNYSQDAGFARPDFSRLLWCACGGAVGLFEIDTSNAEINFIGQFPYTQVLATGFIGGQGGPQIAVTPYQNTQNVTGPYIINAIVTPGGSAIASTKIFWSRNNPVITDSVSMTNSTGNNWSGNIPGNGTSTGYWYYCKATDMLGRTATAPLGAPQNLFSFVALANDTSKPVIVHTPIGSTLKTAWPVYVYASVTDNFGVDSVWVRWHINYNGTEKIFRLPKFSGSTYQALFNSPNSEVNAGDTVFYRIIAQDNSYSHNRDSTIGSGFRIIGTENNCLYSSSTVFTFAYPFNAEYWGSRSQMLYTANELRSVGAGAGNITRIGYYLSDLDTNTMNNFTVKIQSITDTSLSTAFVELNWTTVYSGTYAFREKGWQFIDFQTPFEWDGSNSILLQICFENTIKHFYSSVKVHYVTGNNKVLFEYHDQLNACTAFQTPRTWNVRPSVCFKILPLVEENSNPSMIPSDFKLSQNYPNPFNPATRIKYDISEKAMVTLKIYDMLGREVGTLVNETKMPGTYAVDFNASSLPSGIYLCVLKANSFMQTKRMVLIK